ncbi:hypothetical protein ACWEKJ_39365 [Amycolatopsis thermoflava]
MPGDYQVPVMMSSANTSSPAPEVTIIQIRLRPRACGEGDLKRADRERDRGGEHGDQFNPADGGVLHGSAQFGVADVLLGPSLRLFGRPCGELAALLDDVAFVQIPLLQQFVTAGAARGTGRVVDRNQ